MDITKTIDAGKFKVPPSNPSRPQGLRLDHEWLGLGAPEMTLGTFDQSGKQHWASMSRFSPHGRHLIYKTPVDFPQEAQAFPLNRSRFGLSTLLTQCRDTLEIMPMGVISQPQNGVILIRAAESQPTLLQIRLGSLKQMAPYSIPTSWKPALRRLPHVSKTEKRLISSCML